MTRTCTKCGETKNIEEFYYKDRAKGVRRYWCKACVGAYNREHYRRYRDLYIKRAKANNVRYKTRNYTWLFNYLQGHPCEDCGESNLCVLQFHHTDGNKECDVSSLSSGSIGRLQREVEKCVVLCANCHFLRTFEDRGGHPFVKLGLL